MYTYSVQIQLYINNGVRKDRKQITGNSLNLSWFLRSSECLVAVVEPVIV